MAKLGLGVLGVGRMGRRHAENLRSLVPEARLVAVAEAEVRPHIDWRMILKSNIITIVLKPWLSGRTSTQQ